MLIRYSFSQYKMGLPAVITTDQGSEFKNQLNDEMMKILNIRHHLITAYHPQVDKIKRVGGSSAVGKSNSGQLRSIDTTHYFSKDLCV